MGKNKLAHFAELDTFTNVLQPEFSEDMLQRHPLAGTWANVFGNPNPVTLELGCGKGEYTIGQARLFPDRNFVGIDIKGARIWRGAKTALQDGLSNVRFLRTRIDFLNAFFVPGEVAEIWLTFSDPQPERPRKRLTSPIFVERYRNILAPGGCVHVKTDSPLFHEYTLEQIEEHGYAMVEHLPNVYSPALEQLSEDMQRVLQIRTFYESRWLKEGRTIRYICFRP
jgi:tRNA (guanine-N7-)-methyltransferase